jgi:hypothetical protein
MERSNFINKLDIKAKLKWLGKMVFMFGMLYILIEYIGFGYGLLVFCLCYSLFVLIRGWKTYKLSLNKLETDLFGKPLNKKYWKENEFKNRKKIKIVWSKKKNDGKS